jgi:hypothetical protein
MNSDNQLPTPLIEGARSMELARIWLVDGAPRFVVTPNLWKDAATWGLLTADLIRHIANAYEASGADRQQIEARIKAAFDAEWGNSTSAAETLPKA